jgi:hypothetical protein
MVLLTDKHLAQGSAADKSVGQAVQRGSHR